MKLVKGFLVEIIIVLLYLFVLKQSVKIQIFLKINSYRQFFYRHSYSNRLLRAIIPCIP